MALQKVSQLFSNSFLSESPLTKTLGEEFVLSENGNMIFHWADFFETCDYIKSQLEADQTLMRDFENREAALAKLSEIPFWVRTENKVHQTTMHEVYEKFILNQSHLLGGIDPFCPLEISFISSTGPFKQLSIAECFNKTTYRDFILVYLLQGKLPRRDYRIRLKSKILMEHGPSFGKAEVVALEQLTMNGLLLSMDADEYKKKISGEESVRILLDVGTLVGGKGRSLPDLKAYLSKYSFNLMYSSNKDDAFTIKLSDFSVQSSFDFSKNKRVFLFVSYKNLVSSQDGSVDAIKEFVSHTKELVREFYINKDQKKSA